MPLFYDTAGIPIQLATPQVNYGALANVRPLSLGQNPMQIGASAQWVVPEPKPYIAQGIGQAAQGIAHGMDVAAQAKREEARQRATIELEGKKEEAASAKEEARQTFEAEQHRLNRENALEVAGVRARVDAVSVGKDYQSPFGGVKGKADLTKEPETEDREPVAPGASKKAALSSVPRVVTATPGVNFKSFSAYLDQPAPSINAASPTIPWKVAPPVTPLKATPSPSLEPLLPEQPAIQPVEGRTLSSLIPPSTQASEPKQKEVFADQYSAGTMPRLGSIAMAPLRQGGSLQSSKDAEQWAKEFNRGGGDPNWRAEGIVSDGKGGYKIEYTNVAEERKKAEEANAKRSQAEREHVARITLQEGKAVSGHPAFKNFESPNGLRPQARVFLAAYNAATDHPKQAGAADIDMINAYIRATSGGKVTENEVHLLKDAINWSEKFGNRISKPLTGQALSPEQRDQMLRTILEVHNDAASASNEVLMTARDRMIKGGQTDEIHLPHPYVNNLMLKSDAAKTIEKNNLSYQQLKEAKKTAVRANNQDEIAAIDEQMQHFVNSNMELSDRIKKEKYSYSNILGIHDFHHKRQGYVGGTGGALEVDQQK